MSTAGNRHYSLVAELLVEAGIVPFLGAGANLCDRPDDAHWEHGRFLPSGSELARTLAERSHYPDPRDGDLLRISQYVDAILGEGQLYRYLHAVFDADYPPSSLHRLVARLPALLRKAGRPQLLVVTTNYDDLIERALAQAGESFDVVWYEAKRGRLQGRFLHRDPDGIVVAIERPNKYVGLALSERPVVLKLHGAIDRGNSKQDSYVVTEDSYIAYLAGAYDAPYLCRLQRSSPTVEDVELKDMLSEGKTREQDYGQQYVVLRDVLRAEHAMLSIDDEARLRHALDV